MAEKYLENTCNMENFEMLKALYDFQAVYPKTISFDEGEYFILYQTSARQRNWWQVVSMKGNIGFVPSNYVMKLKVEPSFLLGFLDSSVESLKQSKETEINGIISKEELLLRLQEKKKMIEHSFEAETPIEDNTSKNHYSNCSSPKFKKLEANKKSLSTPSVSANCPELIQESPSMGVLYTKISDITQDNSIASEPSETTGSEDVVTVCKEAIGDAEKEEVIERNDSGGDQSTVVSEECESQSHRDKNRSKDTPNGTLENNLPVEHHHVYEIVDIIRRNTNLSFDLSCVALKVVLSSLEQLFPDVLNQYLESVGNYVNDALAIPSEMLGTTHDSKRLQYIFSQLTDCKNDAEQRSWMLYEDEDDIIQFLEELVDILKNADEKICCYEMSCDQYQSLINLVLYYQMETRWPIKKLILKAFTAACHLDHIIVDILLTSVLPLEVVEDMKTHGSDLEKLKDLIKVLTIIFSLGQTMPVNHQEHLGVVFATSLLEIVEDNYPESFVDLVIALIISFNLQFVDVAQNVVLEALQKLTSAKIFTEKILLLLNREEDPVRILKHSSSNVNAVLKLFVDMFSFPETASLFYTNDIKVLIDILVRQLSDLSAGDPMRRYYLELCRRILRNTNYKEHTHRKQDLMKIFTRIFCEETECSANDQQLVRDIANEFPQIFKA